MVPIITVKSRFYFGIQNCRHEITNRTLANNRIVKAMTSSSLYKLLVVAGTPLYCVAR